MTERLPARDRLPSDPFGLLAVGAVALLLLVVAAAGAVGIAAETVGSWQSLFLMERVLELLVPTVFVLLAVALIGSVGLVVRTR